MTTFHITLIYLGIVVLGVFPFLLVGIAQVMGNWLGCNINEGGTDPCIRFGIQFGKVLNGMMILGWLVLLTGPLAIFGGVGFTVYLIWGI